MMKSSNQAGLYVVLGTAVIVVFILFMGLVVGLGFISLANSRLQDSANLVAQSALKGYAESSASTHADKIGTAVAKANQVFAANPLPGFKQSFGDIKLSGQGGSGGEIQAGHWFRGTPVWGGNPCQDAGKPYPCFIPVSADTPGQPPNAIKAEIHNDPSSNPLAYPFQSFFGREEEQYGATSIASMIDRCFVFLIDVSPSTYYQTHPRQEYALINAHDDFEAWQSVSKCSDDLPSYLPSQLEEDCYDDPNTTDCLYYCAVKPDFPTVGADTPAPTPGASYQYTAVDLSMPFFRESTVDSNDDTIYVIPAPGSVNDTSGLWCVNPPNFKTAETYYWCNMKRDRPVGAVDPKVHYRSDFKRRTFRDKTTLQDFYIWVDSLKDEGYEGPEPYTTFLKAFNAGTAALVQAKSNNDKGMLVGFAGKIMGQFPEAKSTPPYDTLSGNLDMLLQITNPDNFGKIDKTGISVADEVRPNAGDIGLYTVYYAGGTVQNSTNAILGINKAMDVLQRECPAETSRRVIVLASDGVLNCYLDGVMGAPVAPTATPPAAGTATATPRPTSSGASSSTAADYNCGGYSAYTWAEQQLADINSDESVVSRLKANNIALVTIMSGDYIFPHFYNRWYYGEDEEHPMDFKEAYARGYGGYGADPGKTLFDDRTFTLAGTFDPSNDQRQFAETEEDEQDAFNNLGTEGYYFPRPLGVFADVSLLTNGAFCPLMPLCGAACNAECTSAGCAYEKDPDDPEGTCRLKTANRDDGSIQTCAVNYQAQTEQAAACVVEALGVNPYVLVAEEEVQ